MNSDEFEALLYEEEGPALDFKREQYRFDGASDDEKGELLKDILALANSWRRSDGYIVLGVEEVRGGRSIVRGLNSHLDDASVQQFVNSKVQRPLAFSYTALSHEGRNVAVIHVPTQARPFFLRSKYGRLQRGVVYIRRGSSTAETDPDEIARMGAVAGAHPAPRLQLEFADQSCESLIGSRVELHTQQLDLLHDGQVPDYNPEPARSYITAFSSPYNKRYYRQQVAYVSECIRVAPLHLGITNPSENNGA